MIVKVVKVHPHEDRYTIETLPEPEVTKGGLIIPESAKDKPARGRVIEAGPGRWVDGHLKPCSFKSGDVVLFGRYAGTEITVGEQKFTLLRDDEVIGRYEEIEVNDGVPVPMDAYGMPVENEPLSDPTA